VRIIVAPVSIGTRSATACSVGWRGRRSLGPVPTPRRHIDRSNSAGGCLALQHEADSHQWQEGQGREHEPIHDHGLTKGVPVLTHESAGNRGAAATDAGEIAVDADFEEIRRDGSSEPAGDVEAIEREREPVAVGYRPSAVGPTADSRQPTADSPTAPRLAIPEAGARSVGPVPGPPAEPAD